MRTLMLASTAAGCLAAAAALAQQQAEPTDLEVVGHVYRPAALMPTPELVERLTVPDGFAVTVFAEDLGNARMLAVAPDGTVYVTRRKEGDVLMLRDADGDGAADGQETVAAQPGMHGIAIHDGRMYLATVKEVYAADINDDGTLGGLEPIIEGLPDGGGHSNRTLAVGPDGMLYITVGSTCNVCNETSEQSATVQVANLDGSGLRTFATGLRNTIGFGWHPDSGVMYGMDHGIDWLGDEEQSEELNRLEDGLNYGWPHAYGDDEPNEQWPPQDVSVEEWLAQAEEPVQLYTPHSAPMQMAFYTGDAFPEEYRGDAFLALRGSWNRKPPSGYEVVRIRFEDGEVAGFEPFLRGFVFEQDDGTHAQFARLAGLAQTPDGALLISDDENGVIYRIAYAEAPAAAAGGN